MDCKKALKTGTIAVALLVTAILTTQQLEVQASSESLSRNLGDIFGSYANAEDDGRSAGVNDAQNGQSRNPTCPSGAGVLYCNAYMNGYDDGYDSAEKVAQANSGNNNNGDNDED